MGMKVSYITTSGGDWTVLYIDGDMYDQNHSLDMGDVVETLCERAGWEYEHFELDDEWCETNEIPEAREEIPDTAHYSY